MTDNRIQWGSHHGPAINVKDTTLYNYDLPEDEAQAIWEMTAERFWEDANDRAAEHGYAGVYAEGRSGGWMVPHYPNGRTIVDTYDHDVDNSEYDRFEQFGTDILAMLDDYQTELRDELEAAVAEREDAAALLELGTPGGVPHPIR